VAEQDRPHGRRRDPDAQLQQLSADALVAPPGILPAQPDDEAPTSGSIGGRPGWPLLLYVHFLRTSSRCQRRRVSGLTTNERPLASGHRLARRRQQEPVETAKTGALHLPPQHPHLVWKHQELDLPSLIWALPGSEDAATEEVDEREQHGSPSHRGERMLPAAPRPANRGF
jgi:hypothetical protein